LNWTGTCPCPRISVGAFYEIWGYRNRTPREGTRSWSERSASCATFDRLGGVDLYELAERYGTTVRTIRRDLEALQEGGLPLLEERDGKRKRGRIAFKDHLQQLSGLRG
jgi:DNA-binding transcriptional ArsR family regulator